MTKNSSNIIVIGGGAAGMMAAIAAAQNGHAVWLLEKNEKLGKKIYITGKGRCNLTNACDIEDLFNNVEIGKNVTVQGWIRNHRKQKEFGLFPFNWF